MTGTKQMSLRRHLHSQFLSRQFQLRPQNNDEHQFKYNPNGMIDMNEIREGKFEKREFEETIKIYMFGFKERERWKRERNVHRFFNLPIIAKKMGRRIKWH